MIHKVLRVFGFLIDSITILLFQTILVFSLFSESVRLNISSLLSALLSYGVIGLYVLIILTNMFFPNLKLWYFIYQEKTLNMHVLQKTMLRCQKLFQVHFLVLFDYYLALIQPLF